MSINSDLEAAIATADAESEFHRTDVFRMSQAAAAELRALEERRGLDLDERGQPPELAPPGIDPEYERWMEEESRKAENEALALSDHYDRLVDIHS